MVFMKSPFVKNGLQCVWTKAFPVYANGFSDGFTNAIASESAFWVFFYYTSAALDIFQRIYWDDPFIVSMPFNFQVNTQENINIIKQLDEAEYDMENCAD